MLFSGIGRKRTHVGTSAGTRHGERLRRLTPRRLALESLETRTLLCVSPLAPTEEFGSVASALIAEATEGPRANAPPVAAPDAYAMRGDQQLGANVLANDADADGDALGVVLVDGPAHGTLVLSTDGPFTYKPDRGFDGVDTFTYRAGDGLAESEAATVQITVTGGTVNRPPTGTDDTYVTSEDQPLSVGAAGVLANDADADGDLLDAVLETGPRSGILVLGSDGSFDYTPNANFHGTDAFTYRANDGRADSAPTTVTVTVDPANDAPIAADDSFSTSQDQPLAVAASGLLANDQDVDGDVLAAVLLAGPANGALVLGPDGSFEYAPNAGYVGTDSFTYAASDGQSDSNPATVSISVDGVNSAPVAADDSFSTSQDQPLSVPVGGVLANDGDVDGDVLTAALLSGPVNGTLVLGPDGSFEYAPSAGYVGTDSFAYAANDGQADSNPATVSITVNPIEVPPTPELAIHLEVSGTAFGPDAGPIWGGSTFWVSAYAEDLREVPLGVVGGAIDVAFDADRVAPTGNVAYGELFADYRQTSTDQGAGLVDEAGALATQGGVGAEGRAPFIAWEFRRNGPGAPDDLNSQVTFAAEPGEGTGTIQPADFALVGLETPVDWANVQFDTVDLGLYLGDFNDNGLVNHYDLALWIPHESSSVGDDRFDPEYDLSGDSQVNRDDLALLMPRLYRPVLSEPAPAPQSEPAGSFAAARTQRSNEKIIGLRDDVDLDWVDSIATLRGRNSTGSHTKERAVDLVLQNSAWWRLA